MNLFHEYSLLVAVAIPVLAIVGLNVYLWWGGERGTLLMPSSMGHSVAPSPAIPIEAKAPGFKDEAPAAIGAEPFAAAANDPRAREAA